MLAVSLESSDDWVGEVSGPAVSDVAMMPAVKHYQPTEFVGMFEYNGRDDELTVVKKLILGSHFLVLNHHQHHHDHPRGLKSTHK